MASRTKGQKAAEEKIKAHIVERYRAGACDHNGITIPKAHRGMAGKGSHFRPRLDREAYREGYRHAFGHD